jgi:hypothetical protein
MGSDVSNGLIFAINLLVLLFAGWTAATLTRARTGNGSGPVIVIGAATLAGLIGAFLPPLVELRERLPLAQPLMVLGMTAGLIGLGLSSGGWNYFRTAPVRPLIALHGWRLLFGLLLLASGLAGALPKGFFWSVALGDLVAGAWAISIWRRKSLASTTELKIWSAFGLLDLLHLLPRAVITLPPFYAAHPDVFRPILLPLLGVPMLIALHVLLLRRFMANGKTPEGSSSHQLR